MEYAATNVPKPKPRKQWKQDLSNMQQLPGTHILPRAPSKLSDKKVTQSPEKTRMKEFQLLEDKRDLYLSEVDKIKRELKRM